MTSIVYGWWWISANTDFPLPLQTSQITFIISVTGDFPIWLHGGSLQFGKMSFHISHKWDTRWPHPTNFWVGFGLPIGGLEQWWTWSRLDSKVGFVPGPWTMRGLCRGWEGEAFAYSSFADRAREWDLLAVLSCHDSCFFCSTKSKPFLPAQELALVSQSNTLSSVEKGERLCDCVHVCMSVCTVQEEWVLFGFYGGSHFNLSHCATVPIL